MANGVAGHNSSLSFNPASAGVQTLSAVNLDQALSFDVADTTETGQSGEDNTITLQRNQLTGSYIVRDTGDDTAKDAFEAAAAAGTLCAIVFYPTGTAQGNRTYSFSAYITSYSISTGGPAGVVTASFTLQMTGGSKVTVGTVA